MENERPADLRKTRKRVRPRFSIFRKWNASSATTSLPLPKRPAAMRAGKGKPALSTNVRKPQIDMSDAAFASNAFYAIASQRLEHFCLPNFESVLGRAFPYFENGTALLVNIDQNANQLKVVFRPPQHCKHIAKKNLHTVGTVNYVAWFPPHPWRIKVSGGLDLQTIMSENPSKFGPS